MKLGGKLQFLRNKQFWIFCNGILEIFFLFSLLLGLGLRLG